MASYTLEELAKLTQSELIGDPALCITGVEDLEAACSSDASFFENPRYEKAMRSSQAGVIVTSPKFRRESSKAYLLNEAPTLAFQALIELFIPEPRSGFTDIHRSAVVHEEASIGSDVTIGPHAVIDRGVKIGNGTVIGPNVSIGAETLVGENCLFHPNTVVRERCEIGNRVILQPGAVIGSCGFGFHTDAKGINHKLKQLGKVVIEDDVEIGANTTIDRARFKTTRIGCGSKLDNLVQIAHQVELGPQNLMASQVGIAGSTKTGRNVVMGGQVGVVGHITIAAGAILAARSAISKTIENGGVYGGVPAMPIKEFSLHHVQLKSVGKLIKRVKELEGKMKLLEQTPI